MSISKIGNWSYIGTVNVKRSLPTEKTVAIYGLPSRPMEQSYYIKLPAKVHSSPICDGSSPIRIANLNAPVWLGNEWIIGMNDKDNGERILSSSIEAVSIDGQKHQTLSDPSTIAMFPAVSTDNSSIAFNSDNGDIYLMKINIKQKAK